MRYVLSLALLALGWLALGRDNSASAKDDPAPPKGVPEKAIDVLKHVDKHGEAMEGYEGGRNFGNFEKHLPQNDSKGRRLKYQEWDVNPLKKGVNRGPQRLVTGTDGSAWYSGDHYNTFVKIRGATAIADREKNADKEKP